jgi:hypothetical protein
MSVATVLMQAAGTTVWNGGQFLRAYTTVIFSLEVVKTRVVALLFMAERAVDRHVNDTCLNVSFLLI